MHTEIPQLTAGACSPGDPVKLIGSRDLRTFTVGRCWERDPLYIELMFGGEVAIRVCASYQLKSCVKP